jgi:hypothetical protein
MITLSLNYLSVYQPDHSPGYQQASVKKLLQVFEFSCREPEKCMLELITYVIFLQIYLLIDVYKIISKRPLNYTQVHV